jgi:hypothetical protein
LYLPSSSVTVRPVEVRSALLPASTTAMPSGPFLVVRCN